MGTLIKINEKQLEMKEYQGERVVTAWDIAEAHGRDVKRVNEQFNRNIDKLIAGEDYFILSREVVNSITSLYIKPVSKLIFQRSKTKNTISSIRVGIFISSPIRITYEPAILICPRNRLT